MIVVSARKTSHSLYIVVNAFGQTVEQMAEFCKSVLIAFAEAFFCSVVSKFVLIFLQGFCQRLDFIDIVIISDG